MNLPWAELLLAGLRDAGADHLVVSPGSRSTPLVLAAARLGLSSHVLIDERTAGFFALGRARATGRPSVLVCTSGTAGAHYLPAVIEAAMARIPLIVITADRPPELHDCAAPQTIDQIHLFGRFARGFADLGVVQADAGALRAVRRRAAQMVALSRWPEPGPVHINAPARAPLEPSADPGPDERRMIELAAAVAAEPLTRTAQLEVCAGEQTRMEVTAAFAAARRGLLVAGPAPLEAADQAEMVLRLAGATGFPLLAEATSQLRWTGRAVPPGLCDSFDLALRAAAAGGPDPGAPDLIVELGPPPTSSTYARFVARHRGCKRIVIGPQGWSDPHGSASLLVQASMAHVAAWMDARLPEADRPSEWSEAWRTADRRARAALDRAIEVGGPAMGEHAAVRAAVAALPDGALLMLGNSLPVRVADAACPAAARRIGVLSQRGACGIDGLIAGAAGSASVTGRPTALLLGDVSFAHDLGGLAAARAAGTSLAIVVIDNGGGRIFEQLPVAGAPGGAEALERYFVTPPAIDVARAAAAFGLLCRRADDVDSLAAGVRAAMASGRATVIHARVAPHSAREVERAALSILTEGTP